MTTINKDTLANDKSKELLGDVSQTQFVVFDDNADTSLLNVLSNPLVDAKNAIVDLTDSAFNNVITRRKPTTTKLTYIPSRECKRELDYKMTWILRSIPFTRLTRFLNVKEQYKLYIEEVSLKDGSTLRVHIKKPYLHLEGTPILYIDFCEDKEDKANQHAAYELSVDNIIHGLVHDGIEYEYFTSSSSQMRTLKGVFVRKDYVLPEEFFAKFDLSIVGCDNYIKFLRTLRGAEALLEVMSFGSYSHEFSVKYARFLNGDAIQDIKYSLSKLNARIGLCLTSSIPFGKNWRVKKIGKIQYVWTEYVADQFRAVVRENGTRMYSEEEIAYIRDNDLWKMEKADGQCIVRASAVRKHFAEIYGMKMENGDLIGKLIQFRWAGVKGTALVVPDGMMNMCLDKNGVAVYKDYDMIVEDSSWKYTPCEFYTGAVAPEFELVAISKSKHSNNLNYQFIAALDGDASQPQKFVETMCRKVDQNIDRLKAGMTNPEVAKAMLGMSESGGMLDEFGIDEIEMSQRSKLTTALGTCDGTILDPWWRSKFIDNFSKIKDEARVGKIMVEGANRYMITDPIGFFRTDLMNENGDIIIDDPSQVALRCMPHVFWANKNCEAVLFRSPCVSPGEPQRVDLVPLETIPEYVETGFGKLPVRKLFTYIKDLVVVNGFSIILDALGGADTDGDTTLVVTDPDIVALRSRNRKTTLIKSPSETKKDVVSVESIKQNMADSLKNNGIGLITDFATTWRDVQMHCLATKSVSRIISSALEKVKKAAADNLKTGADWVENDPSIIAIAAMNTKDWKSIAINTVPIVLTQLRYLQEMSINTAKSGVWVEFGTLDPEKNNFKHLGLWIRASWHRPNFKIRYESNSVMGQISNYVAAKWKELIEWSAETADPLFIGDQMDFGTRYSEVWPAVNAIRVHYGTKAFQLKEENKERRRTTGEFMSKDEFNLKFGAFASDSHTELTALAVAHGLDVVAIAAYDASNTKDAKKDGEGTSFVWNCFFEEFMETLTYFQNGASTNKLMKIYLDPIFSYTALEDVEVDVIGSRVAYKGLEIGTVNNVESGTYKMISVKGAPYIALPTPRATISELTTSIAGTSTAIIGITKYWKDLEGNNLTREKAIEYLFDMGQGMIKTQLEIFEDKSVPRVACYVRVAPGKFVGIGCLPAVDKAISRALSNKLLRVALGKNAHKDSPNRIVIDIVEVVADFNQPASV